MRRILNTAVLAAALAASSGGLAAQDFTFHWNPRSGDVWVDSWLNDINQYGYRYRDPFVDEMVRYYGAPRDLVTELLVDRHWAPGDVYYACAMAQVVGQPCRYVVREWENGHGQGWGVLAQRLGIKPGSPEFHRLKRGFVNTYDRWGRPIELDDGLRVDFPDRGRGPNGIYVGPGGHGSGFHSDHGPGGGHGQGKGDHGNAGHGQGKGGDHGKSGKGGGHGQGQGGHDKGGGHGQGKGGDHGNSGKGGGKGHGHG